MGRESNLILTSLVPDAYIFVKLLLGQGRCAEAKEVTGVWLTHCEQLLDPSDTRFQQAKAQARRIHTARSPA